MEKYRTCWVQIIAIISIILLKAMYVIFEGNLIVYIMKNMISRPSLSRDLSISNVLMLISTYPREIVIKVIIP